MNNIFIKTPQEQGLNIADNLKLLRKGRKLSLRELANQSGVSYASLRRFEETGEISLKSLIKVAIVLDATEPLDKLFAVTEVKSIDELINRGR